MCVPEIGIPKTRLLRNNVFINLTAKEKVTGSENEQLYN